MKQIVKKVFCKMRGHNYLRNGRVTYFITGIKYYPARCTRCGDTVLKRLTLVVLEGGKREVSSNEQGNEEGLREQRED